MEILYNQNPLHTSIELNDMERMNLWHIIKAEELQERMYDAYFLLTNERFYDVNKAISRLDPNYYLSNDKPDIDKRVDELYDEYLSSLSEPHCGDCTCVACSCIKCHAEDKIGVNTLQGLGQMSAYTIQMAFGGHYGNRTLPEALDILKNGDDSDPQLAKQSTHRIAAFNWLLEYKDKHFPEINYE